MSGEGSRDGSTGWVVPPTPDEPVPAIEPSTTAEPSGSLVPAIELVSTRHLLTVAFEHLGRSSLEMRRASFYVGSVVLGTVGPLALASWAIGVAAVERSTARMEALLDGEVGAILAVLGMLATVGLIVAAVESRTIAVAIIGGRVAGRPVSPRRALARSRQSFWRALVAAIIVAVPIGVAQNLVSAVIDPMFGLALEASVATTTLVTAVAGAPFAYVLAGVVLGGVDPLESVWRSVRVFGARKLAAALVVTFETVAALLILFGATSGLDLALRALDALGLGLDAGPGGLALMTAGIVAAVFAFGTLIYTVIAITVAPQAVMFVGLTHATGGLDRVRAGGPDDPEPPGGEGRASHPRFRTFTMPMLAGFVAGAVLVALVVATVTA